MGGPHAEVRKGLGCDRGGCESFCAVPPLQGQGRDAQVPPESRELRGQLGELGLPPDTPASSEFLEMVLNGDRWLDPPEELD